MVKQRSDAEVSPLNRDRGVVAARQGLRFFVGFRVRNPRGVRGLRHEELIRRIDQAQEALGVASATRWEEQMSAEPREEGEELASRGEAGFRNSIL